MPQAVLNETGQKWHALCCILARDKTSACSEQAALRFSRRNVAGCCVQELGLFAL